MFSIIIPTYNREKVLSRAVNSVLSQSYSKWELIVIDDGSTDGTAELFEQYGSDPRVNYYRTENNGAAEARNFGIQKANYDWIAFLDSDDYWFDNKLEVYRARMEKSPNAQFFFGSFYFESLGSRTQRKVCNFEKKYESCLAINIVQALPTVVLKKSLFELAGGFDASMIAREDIDLFSRCRALTTFECISSVTCVVSLDEANRTGKGLEKRMNGAIQFYEKNKSRMRFFEKSISTKHICYYAYKLRELSFFRYLPMALYAILLKLPIAPKGDK